MGRIGKAIRSVWLNILCSSQLLSHSKRFKFYRIAGIDIEKSRIRFGCKFDGDNKVIIKQDVFINCNIYFDCNERITIGENTFVGNDVAFITTSHDVGTQKQRAGKNIYLPIVVGEGCWIGARSTILPGVTIDNGCIIAAGALVNKDCKPNGLYAGVPAKRIKDLD